ncbi:MAG: 2-amino-4-hydroxy-6-hydroxymethyldihydropteridine diphosphokinase [Actinomycetota bacterium]
MFKAVGLKTRAILALGGNLGDRVQTIREAVLQIDSHPDISVKRQSGLYESFAMTSKGIDQSEPNYLNGVIEVSTSLKPKALLKALNEVESYFGRVRLERWAARTLDIDIISFGSELIETKSLIIPHPRAFERAFVLVPWAELDPDSVLPGHGKVADLASQLANQVWKFE